MWFDFASFVSHVLLSTPLTTGIAFHDYFTIVFIPIFNARAPMTVSTGIEPTGLIVIDGKLIEKPVLRDMYRVLAIADRAARD